jgi:hypothetical protein
MATQGAPWIGKRLPRAKELADFLPGWFHAGNKDTPSPSGYANLKTAAIEIARAPEMERRNLISAYSWAYCESNLDDVVMDAEADYVPRLPKMYVLLRVLFVVPIDHPIGDVRVFVVWNWPPWDAAKHGITQWDLAYPVHADPSGRVLHIELPRMSLVMSGPEPPPYSALDEYDYFSARFHRRSPAEIEALEIW